ncbi:hypothetical protein [Phytohabitans houttuyneae]|uniref:Uncharacterized protein n=1 Tax=Phytohabitans houttuyneae TaxID=1076126 RepID=A0A6V8KIR8_9ACTN|nr:hypothetical protein [Phytohabitans houttuyneae]GFJ83320.1 hypothetical protein Phou_075000 [Phytohabitans houttuyneae]
MTTPPWDRLHHAYGPATEVPAWLAALRDPDPEARRAARQSLSGSIYHQGTRWPASAYAVPALVDLVDDPATPDRAWALDLLRGVAIGDLRDDQLPFAPEVAFRDAAGVTAADADMIARGLFDGDGLDDEDGDLVELADAVVVWWAARAFDAAAGHVQAYRRWLADPDAEVAALAAELVVWFGGSPPTVAALLAVPDGPARPSVNLALAHLPDSGRGRHSPADSALETLLAAEREATAVTAAVALAYRAGPELPDAALTTLVEAAGRDSLPDVRGWDRALRGFVAVALRKVGLV